VEGSTLTDTRFDNSTIVYKNGDWTDMPEDHHGSGKYRNGHYPADCPKKTNVQRFGDKEPNWIHGACDMGAADNTKDIDEYKRTLWQNDADGGHSMHHVYAPRTAGQMEQRDDLLSGKGYYRADTSEDGDSFILVNMAAMKSIIVKKGWR
jgi:hypothetical protein